LFKKKKRWRKPNTPGFPLLFQIGVIIKFIYFMEAILHRIKAWLYDNALTTEDPNDFTARVRSEKSLNVRQMCEAAVARGGLDVSAAVLTQAVESILKAMEHQLCAGHSVNAGGFLSNIRNEAPPKLPVFR
jgi:hypothetical protein